MTNEREHDIAIEEERLALLSIKHYGPGPHSGTGTTQQEAHGGGVSGKPSAKTVKKKVSKMERPDKAPEGWVLHNAPRPLYGPKTWEESGPTGRHWAAIDTSADLSSTWIEENRRLNAVEVVFATEDDAIARTKKMTDKEYPDRKIDWNGAMRSWALQRGFDLIQEDIDAVKHYGPGPHASGSSQDVHGGGDRHRVGITSYGDKDEQPGSTQTNMATFEQMREFENGLKAITGVRNVKVQPGRGAWEGGWEPTWVTTYTGNGEALEFLAETGKAHSQWAVLVVNRGGNDDAYFIRFAESVEPSERDKIETVLAENDIGGWTWFRDKGDHATLYLQSVPAWSTVSQDQVSKIEGGILAAKIKLGKIRKLKTKVTLMEPEGDFAYDQFIKEKRT